MENKTEQTSTSSKPSVGTLLGNNIRTITVIVSFFGLLYVQSEINKSQIQDLRKSFDELVLRQNEEYSKLDELKLDKAVFNATMQQMQTIQNDIRETRGDVKHLLQLLGDKRK